MCGICGIYNFKDKKPVEVSIIDSMNKSLIHRGPDEDGMFLDGEIGLGSRRLSIIDLIYGRQPIHNEDNTIWMVCNGEIYNYIELKETLLSKGHRFYTTTDIEAVIHLYEEQGKDAVKKLRGMFALAIWNKRERSLLLARDRLGVKPLYYSVSAKGIVFASELKSILYSGTVDKEINFLAIDEFFKLGYIPDPLSAVKDINKLEPAHLLEVSQDGVKKSRYWDFPIYTDKVKQDDSYIIEKFKEILSESVRIRLRSDVPIGAFLSGGIDSSTVVAIAAENLCKPIKTFSVGFDEPAYDELKFCRLVSDRYKTDHRELVIGEKDIKLLPELFKFYDEPISDWSSIAVYLLSKFAREHVKVILTGDGADESLAGYIIYRHILTGKIPFIPQSLFRNKIVFRLAKLLPSTIIGRNYLLYHSASILDRYILSRSIFDDSQRQLLYNPIFKEEINIAKSESKYREDFDIKDRQDILYADMKYYLAGDILPKLDRMTMANSLEARSPFLDHELLEFIATLPFESKLKDGCAKYILKVAMKPNLPEEVINREKHSFTLPISRWLRGNIKDWMMDNLSLSAIGERGLFNYEYIHNTVEAHIEGRKDNAKKIWTLLCFKNWLDYLKNG